MFPQWKPNLDDFSNIILTMISDFMLSDYDSTDWIFEKSIIFDLKSQTKNINKNG